MLGGKHVPGVCKEQKGDLCGQHGENRREEITGVVEGWSGQKVLRWWFSSPAACENFLGSFKKY